MNPSELQREAEAGGMTDAELARADALLQMHHGSQHVAGLQHALAWRLLAEVRRLREQAKLLQEPKNETGRHQASDKD